MSYIDHFINTEDYQSIDEDSVDWSVIEVFDKVVAEGRDVMLFTPKPAPESLLSHLNDLMAKGGYQLRFTRTAVTSEWFAPYYEEEEPDR
ncbi:MAG: hypothetical protein ACUVSE_03390 [Armatimonadota bacterium]